MVRRVLFLLVATLLLRGWVGAALAGEMAALELRDAAVHAVAQHGPDCPHAVADEGDEAAGAAAHAHCQGCTLHALPATPLAIAPGLPAASHLALAPMFASADRLQGDKPPISRVSRP